MSGTIRCFRLFVTFFIVRKRHFIGLPVSSRHRNLRIVKYWLLPTALSATSVIVGMGDFAPGVRQFEQGKFPLSRSIIGWFVEWNVRVCLLFCRAQSGIILLTLFAWCERDSPSTPSRFHSFTYSLTAATAVAADPFCSRSSLISTETECASAR